MRRREQCAAFAMSCASGVEICRGFGWETGGGLGRTVRGPPRAPPPSPRERIGCGTPVRGRAAAAHRSGRVLITRAGRQRLRRRRRVPRPQGPPGPPGPPAQPIAPEPPKIPSIKIQQEAPITRPPPVGAEFMQSSPSFKLPEPFQI